MKAVPCAPMAYKTSSAAAVADMMKNGMPDTSNTFLLPSYMAYRRTCKITV